MLNRPITFPNLEKVGRLGNQLWQIASTIGVAQMHGRPIFPPGWSYRPFFEIPATMFGGAVTRDAMPAVHYACDHIDPRQRDYMQCWHYIEDRQVQDKIREVFAPSGLALKIIHEHLTATDQWWFRALIDDPNVPTVSLSVRRGDNTDLKSHPVGTWPLVSMDYYREAVGRWFPSSEVIVFSDDIDWCEQNLPRELADALDGRTLHFMRGGPVRPPEYGVTGYSTAPAMDWIDLQLMTRCQNHILANSTYSWWGAFLGNHPNSQTVYPNNWVGWRIDQFDFLDLMPQDVGGWGNWNMLDNPVDPKHLVAPRRR